MRERGAALGKNQIRAIRPVATRSAPRCVVEVRTRLPREPGKTGLAWSGCQAQASSAPSARERGERAGTSLFTISNSHERDEWRPEVSARVAAHPLPSQIFCSLHAARHSSLPFSFQLATHHFTSQLTSSHSPPPDEGRAERRWRSDACEAPVSARHDRRAVASLDRKAVTAALRSLRTTAERGS
jgi:hypothetical protein